MPSRPFRRLITAALLLAACAGNTYAADRSKIRTLNIGVQAVMTLVSGAVQGKIHRVSDVARCLGSGAVAGYGSYEAKTFVSRGHVQRGWLVANVASSVSENAAAGRNPVSQLGYTVGPIRLRFAVPGLDRDGDAYVYLDASVYEMATLVRSFQDNDRIRFRSGLFAFERDTLYPAEDGIGPFTGTTWGIYPAVWTGAGEKVWHHEVIHAIQSLQGAAVDPPFRMFTWHPARRTSGARRPFRFEYLQLGLVNLGRDLIEGREDYQDRWTEIEAYRLAEDVAP
jgi:hypothetical protein